MIDLIINLINEIHYHLRGVNILSIYIHQKTCSIKVNNLKVSYKFPLSYVKCMIASIFHLNLVESFYT